MSNTEEIEDEFTHYLRDLAVSSKRKKQMGKPIDYYKLKSDSVDNYKNYLRVDKLLDYPSDDKPEIGDSIYNHTNSDDVVEIANKILNDDGFKNQDDIENHFRSRALAYYVAFIKTRSYYENKYCNPSKSNKHYEAGINNPDEPRQQIFFGAPGTGKSYTIKKKTEGRDVIRTTFHPDSDYSTFVGAYKPTTIDEVKKQDGTDKTEKKIVYEFVPQAFLQAYVNAWLAYANTKDGEDVKEQYLIIEEINRGNCAQIFGDLFQLLDRNDDGYSEYPINADKDMEKYLSKEFNGIVIHKDGLDYNIAKKIGDGKVLLLPPNLYIWATMNTSDQSLFPIDSAFKRRWDWKYVPISEAPFKWKLKVNNKTYDWWKFLQAINEQIGGLTRSQDKKLGYFFCKAKNGVIDAETLVGKVFFFLWNEVLKDFQEDQDFLKDGKGGTLEFDDFYAVDDEGKTVVQEKKVEQLLTNLKLETLSTEDGSQQSDEGQDNNENETQHTDETNA